MLYCEKQMRILFLGMINHRPVLGHADADINVWLGHLVAWPCKINSSHEAEPMSCQTDRLSAKMIFSTDQQFETWIRCFPLFREFLSVYKQQVKMDVQ